jgi:pilus assembly protein CpaC
MHARLCSGLLLTHFALLLGAEPAAMQQADRTPLAVVASNAAVMQAPPQVKPPAEGRTVTRDLSVTTGKSLVVDSPVQIQRVSVANPDIAEAVAVSPREIVINGKAPGETSVIVWQEGGNRLIFDLTVRISTTRLESIRRELTGELKDQAVTVDLEDGNVFVRGTVKDLSSAERAIAIASTLGKPVNLLRVNVPGVEAQILLKVRFADVDRTAITELGVNLFSTGALNTIGSTSTQQFAPPNVTVDANETKFTVSEALNLFLFRRDLNLGATIRALQSRRLLQMLAEPNVLAINGKSASFLAGGEFPFPMLQGGGAGLGSITIQFREFGVRLTFLPVVTPRGTIRLQVTPEVSSLDFANGLIFQGFTIPALSTRRVQTEIELESGQSFVIGGLLDNRLTETISKVPGLANIPLLGKLFQTRALNKANSELLVIVTPELVRPIPAGQPLPEIEMPQEFMRTNVPVPRTPPIDTTGPVPVTPPQDTIPVEQLVRSQQQSQQGQQQQAPQIQFVPVPMMPLTPGTPPAPGTAQPMQSGPAPVPPVTK